MGFSRHALLLGLALALPGHSFAAAPLFSSDDPLHITLPVDFSEICRPRESEECDFTETVLEYPEGEKTVSVPIRIRARGGWRSLSRNCSVPLLWVDVDTEAAAGTLFEGQSLLPLTTHCGTGLSLEARRNREKPSEWEQYMLKEHLGHKLYQLFSDASIRSRLVRMHYTDPENNRSVVHNFAFFTEHFDAVAARNGFQRLERGSFDATRLDGPAADRVALFQYMIGNTDWSIVRERNTVLMDDGQGRQVPVPFDFDMSGLVDAHYAGPAPGLPIDSVRKRHYLGFCHPDTDWEALLGAYSSRKAEVMATLENLPGLSRNSLRSTRNFLENFFEIIEGPGREEAIIESCTPWPPAAIDHTTPLGQR